MRTKFRLTSIIILAVMLVLLICPSSSLAADDFVLHFDAGGGSGTMEDVHLPFNSQYQLPECTFTAPEGKTFDTWYVTFLLGGVPTPYETGNGKIGVYEAGETIDIPGRDPGFTVEARWKTAEYTVHFEEEGASWQEPDQKVMHGETAVRPNSNPRRSNSAFIYTFVDWYADESLTELYDFNAPVTKDTTIYAGWGDYAAAYTYDPDLTQTQLFSEKGQVSVAGKEWSNHSAELVLIGQEVTYRAEPVESGYKFRGWSPAKMEYLYFRPTGEIVCTEPEWTRKITDEEGVEGNTFVAIFDNHPLVSFDTRGGSEINPIIADDDGIITVPEDPKAPDTNSKFEGWYTDTDFQNKFDFNIPVTEDMALYARYNVETKVVPYSNDEEDTNGGRAKFKSHQSYPVNGDMKTGAEGTKETIQAKAETHYEFVGWTIDDPEGDIISTDKELTFVIDGAHTYYAVFAMTEHVWNEWEYPVEPTATTAGFRRRVCKLNPNHVEEEVAPEIGGGDDGLGDQTNSPAENSSSPLIWDSEASAHFTVAEKENVVPDDKQGTDGKSGDGQNVKGVKSGDDNSILFWGILLGGSLLLLIVLILGRKKIHVQEDFDVAIK